MTQNPTEVFKMCTEERFIFKAAGNADIHFQYTQDSCSLVRRNKRVFSTHAYAYIYKKFFPFMPLDKNYKFRLKFLINSQTVNNVVTQSLLESW